MIFPLLLILLADAARLQQVDEMFLLPAAEWRYVEVPLNRTPVTVHCRYDAPAGNRIRLALLAADDLARMRREDAHGILTVTPPGPRGYIGYTVHTPGTYYVVVDNRESAARAAEVRLRVWLDLAARGEPPVRTLPPGRRAVVVALSCLAFAGIVAIAGSRLLRGLRR